MKVIFAVDETMKMAYTNNLPGCLHWARIRATSTNRPIKIVACRAGEKYGVTIGEVTAGGNRIIHSGTLWSRKKLESLHGNE